MRKLLFMLRFAINVIRRNLVSSITYFLTIFFLSFLTIAVTTVKDSVYSSIEYRLLRENLYSDIKIEANVEEGEFLLSTSRLDSLKNKISEIFTEFTVESSYKGESISLVGVDYNSFNSFTSANIDYLTSNSCVITNKFAEIKGLSVGDSLTIRIGSLDKEFTVSSILKGTSYITTYKIFVDRNSLIKNYSSVSLGFDTSLFTEIPLATKILIKLKDSTEKQEVIKSLRNEELFGDSLISDASDGSKWTSSVNSGMSIIYVGGIVFLISLSFIGVSIANIRIERNKSVIGTLDSLGAKKSYYYKVLFIESLIYLIISFIISLFLYKLVYNLSVYNKFSFSSRYSYSNITILLGFFLPLAVSSLGLFISYKKNKNIETGILAKEKSKEKSISLKVLLIPITLLVVGLIILLIFKSYLKSGIFSALLFVILSVLSCLSIPFIVSLCSLLFKNNSVFKMINIKMMKQSITKQLSIIILSLSVFGIIVPFSIISTLDKKIENIKKCGNIDYALLNADITDPNIISDIEGIDGVYKASKAIYKGSGSDTDGIVSFIYFVSMDYEDAKYFLKSNLCDSIKNEFMSSDKNYCIISYECLRQEYYKIGDDVDLILNGKTYTYTIIGAAKFDSDQFIYTNDYYTRRFSVNTVVIDACYENLTNRKQALAEIDNKYGANLSVIVDVRAVIATYADSILDSINLFYFIVVAIVISFVLSIVNNSILSFINDKKTYARLSSIGYSDKSIYKSFVFESLLSMIIIIIPASVMTATFLLQFDSISTLFGLCTQLNVDATTVTVGVIVSLMAIIVSYSYYFIGYKNTNIANELKIN